MLNIQTKRKLRSSIESFIQRKEKKLKKRIQFPAIIATKVVWIVEFSREELELVSKELNHLAAMFMPGVWILSSKKNLLLFFKKDMDILLHF